MLQFNKIAKQIHQSDDSNFYEQRDVRIHSIEVIGYHCAESSPAMILEKIFQETNQPHEEESENKAQLKQIRGDSEAREGLSLTLANPDGSQRCMLQDGRSS